MALRKFRPARVFVRRPSASHAWELVQSETSCETCRLSLRRGALLLVQNPGRIRRCERCAKAIGVAPPADTSTLAGPQWTGRDGREARIPESDR